MDEDISIGQRIRHWRKRRRLTQEELAGLVGRSASWMTKVERGELIVDKVSVLCALADILKIDLGYLIAGSKTSRNGGDPHDPPDGTEAVSHALFATWSPDREPSDAAMLRADIERAGQLTCNGFYKAAALVLPNILIDARLAVAETVPGAYWCLAAAYHVVSRFARDVGERELALLTADRGVATARNCGDKALNAAAARDLAFALLRRGDRWRDEAGTICSNAADVLAPTDKSSAETWSLWGSLQLTGAVIQARARDADPVAARRLLADARGAADRVGEGRNDYWEAFGPANVCAHEIAVALELGNAAEALRLANRIDIDALPVPERRAHVLIDIARAHCLLQDHAETVALLSEAVHHSPEDVRYSPKAREMTHVCLALKSTLPGLRDLAQRLGIATDSD